MPLSDAALWLSCNLGVVVGGDITASPYAAILTGTPVVTLWMALSAPPSCSTSVYLVRSCGMLHS